MTDGGDVWETAVFSKKYVAETSDWAGHSGGGSSSFHTIPYRAFLETFIQMNQIDSILDVGCGDWQFSQFVNYGASTYFGYDVVENVISKNRERYGSESRIFRKMPEKLESLPTCSLLIMKDVLQHLSNEKIFAFAKNLFPRYRYCLISNSFEKLNTPQNIDVLDGEFRCLDLKGAPYCLEGTYVCEFGSVLWERIRTLLIQHTIVV